MLRFFRQIRQRLLAESRFSKYLLYAIGEIVLVVFGILIALQINNYNEERKTQIRIKDHLRALEGNLQRDSMELIVNYRLYNRVDRSSDYLWKFMIGALDKIDTAYLKKSFIRAGNTSEFIKLKVAWNDLVSSGDVRHLTNERLRLLLENYYEEDYSRNLNVQQRVEYTLAYWDARGSHMNPYMVKNYLKELLVIDTTNISPLSDFKVNWVNVKKDMHFKKTLVNVISQRIGSLQELNLAKENINALLHEIRLELDKN